MPKNSAEYFSRLLKDKTDQAIETITDCTIEFISNKNKNRKSAAKPAADSLKKLLEMLVKTDRPNWMLKLHEDFTYISMDDEDIESINRMLNVIQSGQPRLIRHSWDAPENGDDSRILFDSIYEKYRNDCRIPELFDSLVNSLQEIINSNAIDSITAIAELEKLVSTLRAEREGSYFANYGAFQFAKSWFINTGWELLEEIPIAKSVVKGLRKTIDDGDKNFAQLQAMVQSDLKKEMNTDFIFLPETNQSGDGQKAVEKND